MSRKRVSPIRKNWQMAHRISEVTGQDVQSARSTAKRIGRRAKIRRFMSDDDYVRDLLQASPAPEPRELSDIEKLELAKKFVQDMGGFERAIEVLNVYEQLVS